MPEEATGSYAGEHEVVGLLARDVRSQLGDEEARDRHLPALVGLGSAPDQPLALHDSDGLGDGCASAGEVEAARPERGHFAEPNAGVGKEQDNEPVGLVLAFIEPAMLAHVIWASTRLGEGVDLSVCEEALLLLGRPRHVDARRDVASQASVLDGHVEDQRQHAVDLADRRGRAGPRQRGHPLLHVGVGDSASRQACCATVKRPNQGWSEIGVSRRTGVRQSMVGLIRMLRVPTLIALDTGAWFLATWLAVAMRLEAWQTEPAFFIGESRGAIPLYGVAVVAGSAAVLHILAAWALRLHQGRSKLGSFEEMFILASVIIFVGGFVAIANVLAPRIYLPRTSPAVATAFALVLCAWPRGFWRILVAEAKPNRHGVVPTPVVLVGAGDAGLQLLDSMYRDPKQHWRPVGFVDDDKRKRHRRYRGVRVLGRVNDLTLVADRYAAETVVVAIPSADAILLNCINDLAREADLKVKVLPPVSDLIAGVRHQEIRDLEPADLLGRQQVKTDVESIAGYLQGRRVLVTGAGGSIGSELCRQIVAFTPETLVMLDRDESALHALLLRLNGRADLEAPNVVLADIRDGARMRDVFELHSPEVVFHAAALKHVNMLEQHPGEAAKTNVLGTLNTLEAAAAVGVDRFVNISTDKAADPENALGYSKRIAEGLTAGFADRGSGTYLSVRFGNVLGTRGSVLTTFTDQIERGGPLTITDPDVTRFFMTIDEAVQLVVQAAAIGRDGEALILDMGKPVRIMDVARQMIEQADQHIDIVITGLKPGEKLNEVLFGSDEPDHRPVHPLISHVTVPHAPADIDSLPLADSPDGVVKALKFACATMVHDAVKTPR